MKQLSQTADAIYSRKRRLRLKQEEFRKDPKKLAAEIARQIRLDQEQGVTGTGMSWDQSTWGEAVADPNILSEQKVGKSKVITVACPTTGCIAGWTTTLAGCPMVIDGYSDISDLVEDYLKEERFVADDCLVSSDIKGIKPGVRGISEVAEKLLGISGYQADWLFESERTLDEVLLALNTIAKTGTFSPDEVWDQLYGDEDW